MRCHAGPGRLKHVVRQMFRQQHAYSLVRLTLPGYRAFSRSLSVVVRGEVGFEDNGLLEAMSLLEGDVDTPGMGILRRSGVNGFGFPSATASN